MTKLCKFWVNTGRCRRAGCTARHGAPEERAAALAAWQLARRPAAVAGPAAAGGGSGGRQGKGQRAAVFAGKMRARSSTPSPLSGRLLSNTRRLAPSNERRQFRTPVSADWLVETYGQARLCSGSGVVEVAGGRGGLAFELCARRGIPCSLVRVASATTAVPAVLPPSCFVLAQSEHSLVVLSTVCTVAQAMHCRRWRAALAAASSSSSSTSSTSSSSSKLPRSSASIIADGHHGLQRQVDPRLADGVTGRRLTRAQAKHVKARTAAGEVLLRPTLFAAMLEPSVWRPEGGASGLVGEQDGVGAGGREELRPQKADGNERLDGKEEASEVEDDEGEEGHEEDEVEDDEGEEGHDEDRGLRRASRHGTYTAAPPSLDRPESTALRAALQAASVVVPTPATAAA